MCGELGGRVATLLDYAGAAGAAMFVSTVNICMDVWLEGAEESFGHYLRFWTVGSCLFFLTICDCAFWSGGIYALCGSLFFLVCIGLINRIIDRWF